MHRCPREQKIWKDKDLSEVACPDCGQSIEFWQGDAQRKCAACGRIVAGPHAETGADVDG